MSRNLSMLVLGLLFCSQGFGQQLSQQSLFHRCYTQLTGRSVPLNHTLMAQVISGKIDALSACKQVLRKGLLGANGEISSRADVDGKSVLNNFYNFHKTWFPSNNLDTISGYSSFELNGSVDVYDATEPALAITYSMFGTSQKYSDVLNRTVGMKALREEDVAVKTRYGWKSSHPGRILSNTVEMGASLFTFRSPSAASTAVSRNINKHISVRAAVPTVQVGDLVGVTPNTESFVVPNISVKPLGGATDDKGILVPNLNYTYDLLKNHGGGVLGAPIYLMQYYGHGMNMQFNGQSKVARRWSQQNMESFLCADLPALRESDVQSYVVAGSSAAFRRSSSCVMCHATLDPMAYTARNFTTGAFDYLRPFQDGDTVRDANGVTTQPPPAYARNAVAITTYKTPSASVSGWPSEPVVGFHTQVPVGRLYFRSVTGELISKNVTGIGGLGKAMSETDDFYQCAAKRYFEFMTGIQVPLYDRTDARNANLNLALTAEAIEDRRYVEDLAKDLRVSGSVVQMIENIMSSSYYSKENFR